MKKSQTSKILEMLEKGDWICTSQMYAIFCADPRRRLCDLKDKGYNLESRPCQSHNYHDGNSKEWRLMDKPVRMVQKVVIDEITRVAKIVEVPA